MARRAVLVSFLATLAVTAATAGTAERWMHVTVEEQGAGGETVRVNVPLGLVEKVLPILHEGDLEGGKVRIHTGDCDLSSADLRAIWNAMREAQDGEYVTVDGSDEKVRVAKSRGHVRVHVEASGDDPEKVEVKVPLDVMDALFSGDAEELDVAAAVRALATHEGEDLVLVQDGKSHVRIWIDADGAGR